MNDVDLEDVLEYLLLVIDETNDLKEVRKEIKELLGDIKEQKFIRIRTRLGRPYKRL